MMSEPQPQVALMSGATRSSLDQQLFIDAMRATEIRTEHLDELITMVQPAQTNMAKIKI